MGQKSFQIGGTLVKPGQRLTLDLPVARLYTHTQMHIPIQVVHGKKTGPRLFVCAAIHGDEINGVEIIRRLLTRKILNRIRGTLIAVPVVNVFGFLNQSRYSPDRRDLNRFFPGKENGSLTSRIAYLFMEEIVARCSHGIDLHTGSNHRTNLPQIRAYLDNEETERLACAFGAPVVIDAGLLEGSLRQAVKDKGIQVLLYEAGEALRFDEVAIRVGLRGIISVMRAIGMLPRAKKSSPFQPLIAHSSHWVRAPISGVLTTKVQLGARVTANAKLGEITDPIGEEERTEVRASLDGVIIGRTNLPLVHKGDALFHIACVERDAAIRTTIDAFKEEFDPERQL